MKRFLIKLLLMVLPIACTIIYYAITVEPHRNGDLGRLGLLPFDDAYDNYINSLVPNTSHETFIYNLDFTEGDCDSTVLVIGDSFSKQDRAGFVNYLGMLYPGYKVLNYRTETDEIVRYQQFINRLVEGKPLPRIVVMESVERYMTARLATISLQPRPEVENITAYTDENTNSNLDAEAKGFYALVKSIEDGKENLEKTISNAHEYIKERMGIVNNPNSQYSRSREVFSCKKKSSPFKLKSLSKTTKKIGEKEEDMKRIFLHSQEYVKKRLNTVSDNPVLHLKLKKKLFTCKGAESDLYYFFGDLDDVDAGQYDIAKKNLDQLMAITQQKGMKFLFMVASDKFDLYKSFTKDKKLKKKKCQLDYFSLYNENDRFLNCKKVLYPHVKHGEKDIYRCHDSHWSPIGAKYVAEEIKRKLDSQN